MKNLWTKRNIIDYLIHPDESLIRTTAQSARSIENNLEEWTKKPKKMVELLIGTEY